MILHSSTCLSQQEPVKPLSASGCRECRYGARYWQRLLSWLQEALKYTESQQQDILHLRRLFYSKLGQLARQRAALLQKVPGAGSELVHYKPVTFNHGYQHVADKLVETTEVAEQLCANRYEESQVYMYCGFCLFRCVSFPNP